MSAAAARAEQYNPYNPYRSTLLPADRVRELSQLRPGRVVRDTIICWATIIAAYAVAAVYTRWWTIALAMTVVGTRYYALFVIGHDGLHRRLFPNRAKNDLFCDLFLVGPIGAITRLNKRNHIDHHQHLATDDDPDRHKYACFNKTDLTALLGYASGITILARSIRNVFFRHAPSNESAAGYTARDIAILAGVQLALIGGLTWTFGWWGWFLMWLIPVYVFTYLGDSIRSFAEHSQPAADDVADRRRLITYVSSPLERLFFAPMNMNYHAAHHLWVSIPYYNLPLADAEMQRHPMSQDLDWRRSYVGYLIRYAFALPIEGCRAPARASSTPRASAFERQTNSSARMSRV